ncbi:MAG: 2-C-methyl-D-erythritol 4-phosphate cytidylyltransferase [Coriobacteriia bacterium]|nr:2-C-methyl-D-erythritol 4-phosphate cytidylyltransferase [Coriobacteriia bacterium]
MSAPTAGAIVVAGGAGERLGRPGGKQLAELAGRPVLAWAVESLDASPAIGFIVIVCHPERVDTYRLAVEAAIRIDKPHVFVAGGDTRQASVAAGLAQIPSPIEIVVVHDGARPIVSPDLFSDAIAKLRSVTADGLVVGYPSADTIKQVDGDVVIGTPDRARLWAVQTPQVFRAESLRRAHRAAASSGYTGTDDASLVEHDGGTVIVFQGPRDNLKVTVTDDLALAEALMALRHEGEQ